MLLATMIGSVITYHLVEKPSISTGRKLIDMRRRMRSTPGRQRVPDSSLT
jgi:hypothetical protein